MKTSFVLIVIDMQVDFFERVPALAAQRASLVAAINALVAEFQAGQACPWSGCAKSSPLI